jgi:hypothetical protein
MAGRPDVVSERERVRRAALLGILLGVALALAARSPRAVG